MQRKTAFLLAVIMLISIIPMSVFVSAANVSDFTDVKESDWFYGPVKYVVDNNLMAGVSDTRFDPNGSMTRAMFVTVLGRHAGADVAKYTKSSFSDVDIKKLSWAYQYIEWAKDNKIVSGTSATTFAPNAPVTREQMMAIFYRYAQFKGINTEGVDVNSFNRFGDKDTASDWAAEAIVWATYFKIIGGTGTVDGAPILSPKSGATRAQVATVIRGFDNTRFDTTTPIGQITIDGNDIGEYTIVYSERYNNDRGYPEKEATKNWDKSATKAAQLVHDYILRSVNADLPVVKDTESAISEKEILIGWTNREGAEGGITPIDRTDIRDQEYIIKVENGKLIIASSERYAATRLGAYCFVTDVLGWDLYNFGAYYNNPKDLLEIGSDLYIDREPFVEYRVPIWDGGLDKKNTTGTDSYSQNYYVHEYSSKTGQETEGYYLTENYGDKWHGEVRNNILPYNYERPLAAGNLVHTLTLMVLDWHNPDGSLMSNREILDKYDDLFFNHEGYKGKDPCLTDEKNIQNVLDCVRAFCEESTISKWFYVCQGDGGTYCTCENCMKVYREEGSYSGTYVRLLNRVCEEFEDEFPNIKFATLAYKHTMIAPKVTKLHKNAMVIICQDTLCHAHNFDDPNCGKNAALSKSFEAWRDITADGNLFVWDYWGGLAFNFAINPGVVQDINRVCYYAKNGVNGYVLQADNCLFAGLRAYILDLFGDKGYTEYKDYEAKADNYLFRQYGYGYTYVKEFINLLGKISETENYSAWPESPIEQMSYDNYFKYKDKFQYYVDKAQSLATTDYQKRECATLQLYLQFAELTYTYEARVTYGTNEQITQYYAAANKFIKDAEALGLADNIPKAMLNGTEPGNRTYNGTNPDTWVL